MAPEYSSDDKHYDKNDDGDDEDNKDSNEDDNDSGDCEGFYLETLPPLKDNKGKTISIHLDSGVPVHVVINKAPVLYTPSIDYKAAHALVPTIPPPRNIGIDPS